MIEINNIIRKNYRPQGTCTKQFVIDLAVDGDGDLVLMELRTYGGGCKSMKYLLQSFSKGRKIEELIEIFQPVDCQNNTSCLRELSKAFQEAIFEHKGIEMPNQKRKEPIRVIAARRY